MEMNFKPLKYIFSRFNSEAGWNIERIGKYKAMAEWLSGLALNIEFNNYAIIKLAAKLGSIEENPSEKIQDKVIEKYWDFMANIIFGFKRVQ